MDILIEPDCFKVCRICMENCEEDFVCIYDEFEDNILMDVITECARVEIRKDDALPRNACRNCAEYMIIAYHIIQKCRDADRSLRSIFKHEIDLRSRKDEAKAFCAEELHINPAEYEFLLSEAYNNMMLENVERLIGVDQVVQQEEAPPPVEAQQYQENCDIGTTVPGEVEYPDLVGVQENQPPEESEQHGNGELQGTRKCCGCKKEFATEVDLQNHSDLIHLNESINTPETAGKLKPFTCTVCYKSFSNQQLLKEHQRSVIRKFFCRQCGRGFMTQTNLDNHLKCHVSSSPEMKKCCGCRKDFDNEADLLAHSAAVHKPDRTDNPDKPFECEVCFRRYPTRKSLVGHRRMIQQHQCGFCGEIFAKKLFLTAHEQTCHQGGSSDEGRKRCCGCRLEFNSSKELLEHAMATHKPAAELQDEGDDEKKPVECEICFKRFSSKLNLAQHQKKASQDRKYTCDICGRTFHRAHDKANHETTHSSEMPYGCQICSRRFKNKLYLKNHYKMHATSDSREFVCHECGKCFRTKDLLKTHSVTHSETRKYACTICPATFKRLQCLKIHTKVHTQEKAFACSLCDKRYIQSSDLKRHLLTHDPGESGKPFQCEYCLRRYPRKDYLKVHIRKQHLEKADMILIEDMALELQGDEEDFLPI
ncbi:zinc finger protein 883-like [Culex pipiens pallens]|uniref:zinc finger protein 883-like n=1 Tax=Culex pipiens pallens TaxID=42434 RepID=UPI0022AA1768|nr:zinc finger protein 883-like [Culex pipiens pallens]XP_052563526.1 zinc finger protein 883-like [Culex pipiens pallens]